MGILERFGQIENLDLPKHESRRLKVYGFVQFANAESAVIRQFFFLTLLMLCLK